MSPFDDIHQCKFISEMFQVEDLVKEDSRVDQYPKLLKGESKVVWEWQGKQLCVFN